MRFVFLSLCLLCTACPDRTTGPERPRAPVEAALTIPITSGSRDALARLSRRAAADPGAAWTRLHYLVDLFDDARFGDGDDSLQLLVAALGEEPSDPPVRGPLRTDWIAEALLVETDAILSRARLHPGAHAARRLLELDAHYPSHPAEVPGKLAPLRALARDGGPLAANARLRLHAYCATALRDAARAPPRRRAAVLSHCGYAIGDRDPDVGRWAGDRAAPPDVDEVIRSLRALLVPVADDPRLARAARERRRRLTAFVERRRSALDLEQVDAQPGSGVADDADP